MTGLMNLLVIVSTDPRVSPRPAEAVRIAAGVAVWGKVRLVVWLDGPAALGLEETRDDVCDGEILGRHLEVLQQAGGRVLVTRDNPHLPAIIHARVAYETVESEIVGDLVRQQDSVIRL
jgi:hypothetical protein